jgi:aminobenzoyl-glutamate utilization protein A
VTQLPTQLIAWRRDFHAYPELGFREFRTAAKVCDILSRLDGCRIHVGSEVMVADARLGAPSPATIQAAQTEALHLGADPAWISRMDGGLTAVVAEWTFARPGPTLAFRFDLDALPVHESESNAHLPAIQGFRSYHAGRMHACGHDGHVAIGLGLASLVSRHAARWGGCLKLIFQPAEEGCCGAASMVARGIVDDVDYFVAGHLGTVATETGLIACGIEGLLATTKIDVTLHGRAAHAGMKPHEGRNALLAAATAALQLHAIPRHGDGDSRVNVGRLLAGTGRNIVADRADLQVEVRGASTAINDFMTAEAQRVIAAAAAMHDVTAEVKIVGSAQGARCDTALKDIVRFAAQSLPRTKRIVDSLDVPGSEDATYFMNAVQERGGQATYLLIGSALAAGHHEATFDFDEASLLHGVELYTAIADRILSPT